MGNRLAEIDEKPTSDLINSDTKVVLKLQGGLSLADFANSLKMRDMPLNTKLKELTNSLFPANEALLAHDQTKIPEVSNIQNSMSVDEYVEKGWGVS